MLSLRAIVLQRAKQSPPMPGDCVATAPRRRFGLGFDTCEKITRPTQPAALAMTCRLLRLAFRIRTLRRQSLSKEYGKERDQDHKGRNHIRHRPVTRTCQLRENPNRQSGLLPGCKCCNDHFIEREREGKHSACEQGCRD